MNRQMRYILAAVIIILAAAIAVFAQENPYPDSVRPLKSVALIPDNYAIVVPESWTIEEMGDQGVIRLIADELSVNVLTDSEVPESIELADDATAHDILQTLNDALFQIDLNLDQIRVFEFETTTVSIVFAADNEVIALTQTSNGAFVVFDASVTTASFTSAQSGLLVPLFSSVTYVPPPEPTDTADVALAGNDDRPVACIVTLAQGATVGIRLGPGIDRARAGFLRDFQDYFAIARAVRSGATWYQLDKTLIDPGSSAEEMWVVDEGIELTGDCESLTETAVTLADFQPTPTPQPIVNPCMVTADADLSATVRLGPSNSRSTLAYLRANEPVTVVAQRRDEFGNLWYQLDKQEFDPTSAAVEMWVMVESQDPEVEPLATEGDCDLLPNVAPAPFVVVSQPDDQPTQPAIDPSTFIIPRSYSNWIARFDDHMAGTCTDGTTDSLPTVKLGDGYFEFYTNIVVGDNGTPMFIDFNTINRTADGSYQGYVNFAHGGDGYVSLQPTSPDFMVGTLAKNSVPIDGERVCDVRLPMTVELPEIYFEIPTDDDGDTN